MTKKDYVIIAKCLIEASNNLLLSPANRREELIAPFVRELKKDNEAFSAVKFYDYIESNI